MDEVDFGRSAKLRALRASHSESARKMARSLEKVTRKRTRWRSSLTLADWVALYSLGSVTAESLSKANAEREKA